MRGPAAFATYMAVALIIGGFAIIFGAWNGAAALDQLAAQFPYLVSGGMVGLGFVISGCALWIVQTARQLSAQRAVDMQRLDLAMAGVAGVLVGPSSDERPLPADQSRAGHTSLVVAGASSFHESSCHLVSHREDLTAIPRSEATSAGLAPCRICKPE